MNRLARLQRLRRQRRRVLAAAMVGVPLLTSGCGPSVPVQLGMKNVPLDIAVGKDTALKPRPPASAPPVAEALPAFAPVITPVTPAPTPGFVPPPPVVVGSGVVCPELDPTRASPAAATPEVEGPATDGRWRFMSQGQDTLNGAATALPSINVRTISAALGGTQGSYTFAEQGVVFGFPNATSTYAASNSTSAPANPLVSPTSFVGLTSLQIQAQGGLVTFQSPKPLKLLSTPAQPASAYSPDPNNPALPNTTGTWTDTQTDAQDGSAMTIQGTDNGTVRVNACGTPVDAWQVHATITLTGSTVQYGPVSLPGKTELTFDVTYAVATGLGGMIVAEQVKTLPNSDGTAGTLAGSSYSSSTTSTIAAPQPVPS